MAASLAALERETAALRRRFGELALAAELRERPARSAVEMAGDLGLALDPWQERALCTDSRDILLLASRQAGKSTVAGIMALHQSVYVPGSTTLIVSPTERQSKLLLRTIRKQYGAIRADVPPAVEGLLSLVLRNGSELHALPGSEATVRGFSAVDLLLLDEGARIPDELYYAVRPMLAVSNGRLVALSTPFGRRGWFWSEWDQGGDAWHRERVPAELVPRIAPAFLARERERLGRWWFDQEYGCLFLEAEDQLFSFDDITAALRSDLEPLWGGERLLA